MFDGEFQQRMAALQAEFGGNVRAVVIHCSVMNVQFFGNFLAGFVLRDQFENPFFGGGQVVQAGNLLGEQSDTIHSL